MTVAFYPTLQAAASAVRATSLPRFCRSDEVKGPCVDIALSQAHRSLSYMANHDARKGCLRVSVQKDGSVLAEACLSPVSRGMPSDHRDPGSDLQSVESYRDRCAVDRVDAALRSVGRGRQLPEPRNRPGHLRPRGAIILFEAGRFYGLRSFSSGDRRA